MLHEEGEEWMLLPYPLQRRPDTEKGVLLVFIGVLMTPIVPPVGLGLSFIGLLLPYYRWKIRPRLVPVPVRVCRPDSRQLPNF